MRQVRWSVVSILTSTLGQMELPCDRQTVSFPGYGLMNHRTLPQNTKLYGMRSSFAPQTVMQQNPSHAFLNTRWHVARITAVDY
jgi:hypothetical protein